MTSAIADRRSVLRASDATRGLRPSKRNLLDAAALSGLSLLAVYAFRSSYGGTKFLAIGAAGVLTGTLLAHVATVRRLSLVTSILLAAVTYPVVGAAVSLRARNVAGVLPTVDSMWAALRSVVSGWKELVTTSPPVGDLGDLLVLPFLCGFVAAFVSTMLARRFAIGLWSIAPATAVLALGIVTGVNNPVSVLVHGVVFGLVAFVWLAERENSRRPLLGEAAVDARRVVAACLMLGVAGVAGFAISPSLPLSSGQRTIWRETVTPPFDPQQHPSPLAGYRRYVKDAGVKDEVMFTIEGLPAGVPVRLATMDAYDGMVWQVSSGDPEQPSLYDSGSFQRVGTEMIADTPGPVAQVTVVIGKYADVWIPDVGEVMSLTFSGSDGGPTRDRELAEAFRYNLSTDTAASRTRLREGDRYVMKVVLPSLAEDGMSGQQLEANARVGQAVAVSELTQKLFGPDILTIADTGERLDAVAALMVDGGTYSDGDRSAGQQGSAAGHSLGRMALFVSNYPKVPLIGNAEQYSSAFALLFREVDHLPTRVVMGFRPSASSQEAPVNVYAKDVDAWVEVPVRNKGWMPVFPTPPRDQTALTSANDINPEPDYRTQTPPPPPVVDPEFEETATSKGKAKSTKDQAPSTVAPSDGSSIFSNPIFVGSMLALSPFLAVGLVGGVLVMMKARRRKIRRTQGPPHRRIAAGWAEVADHALDLGRPLPVALTRREAGSFIAGPALALAERADAAVWGGVEPSEEEVESYWKELSGALEAMGSEFSFLQRLRAMMSPRSLRLGRRFRRRTAVTSSVGNWSPVRRVGARRQALSVGSSTRAGGAADTRRVAGPVSPISTGVAIPALLDDPTPTPEMVEHTVKRSPLRRSSSQSSDQSLNDTVIRSERPE